MQVGLRISHREKNPISDRALLFAFFAAGVSAAYFGSVQLSLFSEPRLFFSGLMAGVLLFSASLLGAYLLPLAAMLLGAFTEQPAMGTAALWRLLLPCRAPCSAAARRRERYSIGSSPRFLFSSSWLLLLFFSFTEIHPEERRELICRTRIACSYLNRI